MIGGVLGTKQVLLPVKKAPDIFRESMKLENFKTEDKSYMRDYVWDEKGHVRELSFHNIKNS